MLASTEDKDHWKIEKKRGLHNVGSTVGRIVECLFSLPTLLSCLPLKKEGISENKELTDTISFDYKQ